MLKNKFWLNAVLDQIESVYPEGEIVVSSGISPSADYHIGHFREILSADLVKVGLSQRGRQVRHIHVVDNFDPLRKRYEFLPEEYEQYVGWPVCLVPDPEGCHDSYAEHFFQEFYKWVKLLSVDAEVIRNYQDLYQTGKMAGQIETAIEKVDLIREILNRQSNRQLGPEWAPVQIVGEDNRFYDWEVTGIDKDSKTLEYHSADGKTGSVKYDDGKVKLRWRVDWPARWQLLGVMVEPHGWQEHGAAGGSYQTGLELAKRVFGFEGPLAGIQYGHVHLKGESTKMSSSKGNLVTPAQAFEIMPPEMLRYFYARYPGKKRIDFDPGLGLYRMMDEFSKIVHDIREGKPNEFEPAYRLAVAGAEPSISSVPFNHLVTVYQAALGDEGKVLEILARSGYQREVKSEAQAIKAELSYVKNWLDKWAPTEVKFALLDKLPKVSLTTKQKQFLAKLADKLEDGRDGDYYHQLIYQLKDEVGLEAKDAFMAIYQVLLGKPSGPKAGWFIATLDKDWLAKRFRLEG